MRTRGRRECEIERGDGATARAGASAHGFTITEVAVALTLAALALAIALPVLNRPNQGPQNLAADLQDFALNLQAGRDLGISRGTHYRVRIISNTAYVMEIQKGGWVTERAPNLRPSVKFDDADIGKIAEFDTRGLCVSTACISSPPITFTLTDTARSWSKQVKVYARGMVDRP